MNAVIWVVSNIEIAYIALMLIVFVVAYPILFDPSATTAGKFVFRFAASLVGIIGLVFIGIFVDPRQDVQWWQYPGDVIWWRPAVRLIAYSYVAYTITALVTVLWMRKFRPQLLHTAPNESTLPVKVRKRHDKE